VCSFAIAAPFQARAPAASSEPGEVSEAIKSVASDVHAPHPVSSRQGELTSSAGMPELLLRGSDTGSVLGFSLDNLVEKGHGGPTGERQGKLTFQETEELSASTSLTRHERVSPVHGS
jgi:hypothetical protein